MLITSFAINPGPGPNPTVAQLIEFGKHYRNATLWRAWLQTIGSLLCVLFAIAGLLFLFTPILLVVVALSFIQALWFLTAAITLLVRAGKASNSVAGQQRKGVTA
jgi:hypothetical protein